MNLSIPKISVLFRLLGLVEDVIYILWNFPPNFIKQFQQFSRKYVLLIKKKKKKKKGGGKEETGGEEKSPAWGRKNEKIKKKQISTSGEVADLTQTDR